MYSANVSPTIMTCEQLAIRMAAQKTELQLHVVSHRYTFVSLKPLFPTAYCRLRIRQEVLFVWFLVLFLWVWATFLSTSELVMFMPQLGDKMASKTSGVRTRVAATAARSANHNTRATCWEGKSASRCYCGGFAAVLLHMSRVAASRFLKDGLRPQGRVVVTGYKGHSPLMTRA